MTRTGPDGKTQTVTETFEDDAVPDDSVRMFVINVLSRFFNITHTLTLETGPALQCAGPQAQANGGALSLRYSTNILFLSILISLDSFLDASTHLYMRVCPSVRPSVGRSRGFF